MIEENETQETNLQDLIDLVERDDLPTNEFTIQDTDPMVILGKLNEVIAYLQTLQATINASDSKANEALQRAIQAVEDATQALSVANGIDAKATQALANAIEAVGTANTALSASNTALSTANTAIGTANTALSSANSAVETAEDALDTAESAETKADTAITTANGAETTAEGIDAKATTALSNSQTAVSTANTAETKAQEALDQVVSGLGTKVYANNVLQTSWNADTKADLTRVEYIEGDNVDINDDINSINETIGNIITKDSTQDADITALQSGKATKLSIGQWQVPYRDIAGNGEPNSSRFASMTSPLPQAILIRDVEGKATFVGGTSANQGIVKSQLDSALNGKVDKVTGKQLSTEDFTTTEKNKLAGLSNYDDTQVQSDITGIVSVNNTQNGRLNTLETGINNVNTKVDNLNNTCTLLGDRIGKGTISLSQPITNFKHIVFVNTQNDNGTGYMKLPNFLPVSFITTVGYGREYAYKEYDDSNYRIRFNSASQAEVTAEYYIKHIYIYGIK